MLNNQILRKIDLLHHLIGSSLVPLFYAINSLYSEQHKVHKTSQFVTLYIFYHLFLQLVNQEDK